MDSTSFEDEEVIERNVARSRARVDQIRHRRLLATGTVAASVAAIAWIALVVRDPAPLEIETGDPRPPTSASAPPSVPASTATTTTTAAPEVPQPTQTPTTVVPSSVAPPPPATSPTTFVPSEFEPDAALSRTRERLLAVGDGWVEIDDRGIHPKRLAVAPDAQLAMLVAANPCCAAITVASLDDLEIGAEYWFGNSNPNENFHYPIGEPIREIVEMVPAAAYEGMTRARAERVAVDVQGLRAESCETPEICDWQYGFSGSVFFTLEDGVVIHATFPGW